MSYSSTDPVKINDLASRLLYLQSEYKSVLDEINRHASTDPDLWLSLGAKVVTPISIPNPSLDVHLLELMGSRWDTEEWVQSQAHPPSDSDELGGRWRMDEEIAGDWGARPAPVSNAPSSPFFGAQFDTFDSGRPSTVDPSLLMLPFVASSSSGHFLDHYFNSPPFGANTPFSSFGSPFTSPTDSSLAFSDALSFQCDALCQSPELSPLELGSSGSFASRWIVDDGNIWDSGTSPGKGAALFPPLLSSPSPNSLSTSLPSRKGVPIPDYRTITFSGAPLARSSPSTGRSRRGSSGNFARFSPLNGHTRMHSLDAVVADPHRAESASGISTAIATLSLGNSISPPDSPLLRSTIVSLTSSNSKRAPRTMTVHPAAVFKRNADHLFAVHSQAKCKVDVGGSALARLRLEINNPPTSPLWRVVYGGEQYTRSMYYEDVAKHSTYLFTTDSGDSWRLGFSQFGTQITPRYPVASQSTGNPTSPIFTFLHFLPNDIVVSPSQPLGSIQWWRLQDCSSRHEKMPGTGAWTARYDDEAVEKRRPARIIAHFARCPLKHSEGDFWSLGKLARAVMTTLPVHGGGGG